MVSFGNAYMFCIRFLSYVQGSLAQAFDEPEGEMAVAELLQALEAER